MTIKYYNLAKNILFPILIAIRSDINATSKRISLCRGAEIVAIEVTINNSKFIFCSIYRVGNLGTDNYNSVFESFSRFFKGKKPKKIFILGDFNFSGITWPIEDDSIIHDPIELLFTESFKEFGLDQHITLPTHIKGKTLDLLLTNYSQLVHNIEILDKDSICKSAHYPIRFEVNIKQKKLILNRKRV